jgi:hypothetical protein
MKILRATFLSIRGVPDMTINLGDTSTGSAHDVVAVTGPAGCGKTRLLEALVAAKEVVGACGSPVQADKWIREGSSAAKIELTLGFDETERGAAGLGAHVMTAEALFGARGCRREADDGVIALLERYEHEERSGKLEYFPDTRCLPPPGPPHGTAAIEQRAWRASRDERKYGFIPRFLTELPHDAKAAARFAAALTSLDPGLSYVGQTGGDPLRCFASRGRAPSKLRELSTTESHAVLIAATAALVRFERSIVMIDRPESSSDERSIVALVNAIRGLAQDMQLLVATSSPALVASLDPRAVIDFGESSVERRSAA